MILLDSFSDSIIIIFIVIPLNTLILKWVPGKIWPLLCYSLNLSSDYKHSNLIGSIHTFLTPHYLFIFAMTINIWKESLKHEFLMKSVVDWFRQITKDHPKYVTMINSLNTIPIYVLSLEQFMFLLQCNLMLSQGTNKWNLFD